MSSLIERAARDCGQDPDCSCDWAGMPRECLYEYCCGTVPPLPLPPPSGPGARSGPKRKAPPDGRRPPRAQIAHKLGQERADYGTDALGEAANPTPAERVDAYRQAQHLAAWQQVCQPDQTLYSAKCSSEAVPALDNRKHR